MLHRHSVQPFARETYPFRHCDIQDGVSEMKTDVTVYQQPYHDSFRRFSNPSGQVKQRNPIEQRQRKEIEEKENNARMKEDECL